MNFLLILFSVVATGANPNDNYFDETSFFLYADQCQYKGPTWDYGENAIKKEQSCYAVARECYKIHVAEKDCREQRLQWRRNRILMPGADLGDEPSCPFLMHNLFDASHCMSFEGMLDD